jgi:hypothetical protein
VNSDSDLPEDGVRIQAAIKLLRCWLKTLKMRTDNADLLSADLGWKRQVESGEVSSGS